MNLNYRIIVGLSALCAAVAFFFIFFRPQESINASSSILRVGTNVGYLPYVFSDEQGSTTGFDVDVVNALARKMGKTIIIEDMAFDALIIALKQNKVDLIIGGIAITPSRLEEIAMVPYHGQGLESMALLFWGKAPSALASMSDFRKLYAEEKPVIVTQTGTVFEPYLQKWTDVITPKTLTFIDEIIFDLRYAKAVAALLDTPTAKKLKQLHTQIDVIVFPVAKEDQSQGSGIGIRKDNSALLASVKQGIQSMRETGELQAFAEKWFVKE